MRAVIDKIESDAQSLEANQRMELAARLLKSVEPDASSEVEAAWETEIRNRIDRYDRGETNSIPAAEVFEGLAEITRVES